jgi:hypothetical protein
VRQAANAANWRRFHYSDLMAGHCLDRDDASSKSLPQRLEHERMGRGTFGDWMAIDDQDPHNPDVASVMGSSTSAFGRHVR